MSRDKMLGYVHVPRTGGWSVACLLHHMRPQSQTIKYLGHVPNSADTQRQHVTVSCVRHPYERFISMYKHRLAHYDNDSKWKIQHFIDQVSVHGWKGYQNYWFKHKPSDILLRHTHLQADWSKLINMFDLDVDPQLPHQHNTSHVEYIEPTAGQRQTISRIVESDVKYYEQVLLKECICNHQM